MILTENADFDLSFGWKLRFFTSDMLPVMAHCQPLFFWSRNESKEPTLSRKIQRKPSTSGDEGLHTFEELKLVQVIRHLRGQRAEMGRVFRSE